VQDGYRESEQSWKEILLDLKARGLTQDPVLPAMHAGHLTDYEGVVLPQRKGVSIAWYGGHGSRRGSHASVRGAWSGLCEKGGSRSPSSLRGGQPSRYTRVSQG